MAGLTRHGVMRRAGSSGERGRACDESGGGPDCSIFLSNNRDRQLERTIEGEIIPRLMLVHKRAQAETDDPGGGGFEVDGDVVAEFTRLVLAHDTAVVHAYVEAMRGRGLTLENLFLELLTGTARNLGELWKQDACDFMEVTLGLSRLQQLLRRYGAMFENEVVPHSVDRRGLLAPVPGEQHTFGVFVVEEFFRRAGWDIWMAAAHTRDELVGMLDAEWYALVGFSVSRDELLDDLAASIGAIRKRSRNQGVCIMVGGRVFSDRPELVARVGADATAADGKEAVRLAEDMMESMSRTC